MNNRGFIQLSLLGYIVLGMSMIVLGLSIALKVQSARLDSAKQELAVEKAEFASFVKQVNTAGIAAKAKADAENKLNEERKRRNEVELRKLRLANNEFKRLRDADTRSRRLPEAPANSRNPELSCFDRPELERAYGELVKGLRAIADEGTESAIGLNSARSWAQGR